MYICVNLYVVCLLYTYVCVSTGWLMCVQYIYRVCEILYFYLCGDLTLCLQSEDILTTEDILSHFHFLKRLFEG